MSVVRFVVGVTCALVSVACATMRPDCSVEATAATSVEGSAACIILVDGRLLVIRHLASGKLDLPGGRARPGETAQCTAHRETWEETGVDVRVGGPIGTGQSLFRCTPIDTIDPQRDPAVRWWSMVEVAEVLWVDPRELRPEDWRYGRAALDFIALPP